MQANLCLRVAWESNFGVYWRMWWHFINEISNRDIQLSTSYPHTTSIPPLAKGVSRKTGLNLLSGAARNALTCLCKSSDNSSWIFLMCLLTLGSRNLPQLIALSLPGHSGHFILVGGFYKLRTPYQSSNELANSSYIYFAVILLSSLLAQHIYIL